MTPGQFALLMSRLDKIDTRLRNLELKVAGLFGGLLLLGVLINQGVITIPGGGA